MSPREPTSEPSATDLFEASARRVADEIANVRGGYPGQLEGADMFVEQLARDVRQRLEGPAASAPLPGSYTHPVAALFLDSVRDDLILHHSSPSTARPTLQALAVIASFRARCGANVTTPPEIAEDLATRLRAPDAFSLLVEVAHDLRSPLTSILFLSETMRDGHSGAVTDLQRTQLGLIYSAAFGLAAVVSDIMDFARRETDLLGDERELYSVSQLFEGIRHLVAPMVDEKGLDLRVVLPARLQAYGYPRALSRVMLNLTTNALKFTDEGEVEIGVEPLPHDRLGFYVRDTGRGIPVERQAELFQPFKRRGGDGPVGLFFSDGGVGLSMARRLVRAMGSELEFETSEGVGTRFHFSVSGTLPQSD